MRLQRGFCFGILLIAGLVLSSPARADVIISNLPGNDGTSTFINAAAGGSNGGGVFDSKAAGFTLPAGTDYALDAALLRLGFFDLLSDPLVELYDDVLGNPGASLLTFVNPAFAVGAGTYSFAPAAPFVLAAATTYWLVVSNDAGVANSFRWMANNPSIVPTGIAASAGYWFSNGAPPPTGASTTFNSYEVQATAVAVPVPPALVLLGMGLVGVFFRRTSRQP